MARQAAARSAPSASARLASKNQWLPSPDANRTGSSKYRNPLAFTASSNSARSSVTPGTYPPPPRVTVTPSGRRSTVDVTVTLWDTGGGAGPSAHHDDGAGDLAGVGVGEGLAEARQGQALRDERLEAQLPVAVQGHDPR